MNEYRGQTFTRISKAAAKKMYERGENVYICACKMNPEGHWFHAVWIHPEPEQTFEQFVNAYTYYNCNYETGYYPAFYKGLEG